MRTLIITSGGYLDKRIERILSNNNINGDITRKLTREMINRYDCVIFSHNNENPNLPKLIETIVLERKVLVIYINNTTSLGYYYNIINDLFFSMINESTLDIELPLIIKSTSKYTKRISNLEQQVRQLEEDKELQLLTKKAKLVLMKKGFTEAESHKFIQRKSMSMRVSKRTLVNLIISNKIDI
jgi:response regulator NasT